MELRGSALGPQGFEPPTVSVDGAIGHITMCRSEQLVFRVPELASAGLIEVRTPNHAVASASYALTRSAIRRSPAAARVPCAWTLTG